MAKTELTVTLKVAAPQVEQFIADVKSLLEYSENLRVSSQRMTGLPQLAQGVAVELRRIAVNLSKIELA